MEFHLELIILSASVVDGARITAFLLFYGDMYWNESNGIELSTH